MKTRYYITDRTSNEIQQPQYITDIGFDNSPEKEGCISFDTHEEAMDFIYRRNWGEWAGVSEE